MRGPRSRRVRQPLSIERSDFSARARAFAQADGNVR